MATRKQATPEEIKTLKASLKKLKPGRRLHFLYFDHGEDNAPVLVIEKNKIAGERLKSLTASAKKKKPIKGSVSLNSEANRVEFRPIKAPGKLQRALKKFYKQLPQLKSARVVIGQDKESVALQMSEAREVSAEKARAAQALKRQQELLQSQLEQLEAHEKKAAQELAALEAESGSVWNVMRNRTRSQQLELLKRKEEQRKWEADQAREKLRVLTEELTLAEIERQAAEEEAADLKDMWSLIQQQEWEDRQRADSDWRDEIEANMDLLSAKTEAADILGAHADELEGELLGQEAAQKALLDQIQALEHTRLRAPDGALAAEDAEELTQLKDRHRVGSEAVDLLKRKAEEARSLAERAESECSATRDERNRVFMTPDQRERADELREELTDAEESAQLASHALQEAIDIEDAANESLRAVNDTAAEVERLRLALASANFDVADLEKGSSKWSYGLSSRRKAIQSASDDLPAAKARAAQLQTELDSALARLSTLEDEAAGSLEQARNATAVRLALQARSADADRDLALVQQEIAEEEATIEEWACDLRRKSLSRAIQQDPALREVQVLQTQREQVADENAEALLEHTAALSALRDRNEEIQREMAGFSQVIDPDLTSEYAENLKQLTQLSKVVAAARTRAESSCRLAEEAAQQFENALEVRCRESSVLAEARSALAQSERALERAAAQDLEAIKSLENADDQSVEVKREEAVYGLLIDGQALVRKHTAVFEKLRGLDLFNSSDIQTVRDAVGPAADKLKAELDKHAFQMIQAGATAQELAQVFERVPNGLRPAAYREEVIAVDTLMQRFDEIQALKTQEDRDEYLIETARQPSKDEMRERIKSLLGELDSQRKDVAYVSGQAAFEGGRVKSWMTMLGAVDSDSASQQQLASVLKVLGQISRANGRLNSGIAVANAFSAENEDEDPVLQKLHDQEKLDAINGLANAGLDVARQFVPVLLTVKLGKGFIEDAVQCASRSYKAHYDSKLKALAKVHGSPLAGPLEESLGNELKLAERYGFNAAVKATIIAAQVLKAGPQAAMGFVLAVAASSTAKANSIVHDIVGWKQAAKAKALLERAQAGDDKAKSLLLKHHAKYAKGMLALKAQEGDPFAVQYVGARGLSESDIRKSSFDIITRYLLKSAKQSGNEQTFEQWVQSRKAMFARLASIIVAPLSYSWRAIFDRLKARDTIGDIEVPSIEVPLSDARELVAVVEDSIALRERLLLRQEPTDSAREDLEKTIEKVTEMIDTQRREGLRLRERTGAQILRIAQIEQRFESKASALRSLELDDTQKVIMSELQARVPRIRLEHVELAGILAALA